MRIYLIRHGESEANLDQTMGVLLPEHSIALSLEGQRQAKSAGETLRSILLESPRVREARNAGRAIPPIRMWRSPYRRTRETADSLLDGLGGLARDGGLILDVREKSQLREQEFGLFGGVSDDELPKQFPREYAHYRKNEDNCGRFWAAMPMGESRCNVAERVHTMFGTFHRDAERHDIHDIIVVSHGVTIRAFVYAWIGYEWEWFEKQSNPRNCSIWLLENDEDRGLLFAGWPARRDHVAQERREAGVIGEDLRKGERVTAKRSARSKSRALP
jgi:2,3-bisphosphoglycerate-dependent phosphoglycerate mutase